MSRGHIARASRRHPDARRRALRYGRTQIGRRPHGLPPHLLPGVTGRGKKDNGTRLRLALAGVLLALLFATGAVVTTVASAVAGASGTVVAYREVNKNLPNAGQIVADTPQTSRILDRAGNLLYEFADPVTGWRTFVPLDQVSQVAIDATIAAEDATFWQHHGVEPYAIARGLAINLTGAGSSGASTITQQIARSLYPEKIGNDVTYTRKGKEALAAVALERAYTKQDILTMYVNQIFYGNRSYGIEAAAQTFFHKNASELNLSEASLLAGLPQQPTGYNPSLYPEEAKERQEYVLDQMVKLRYLTRAEAEAAADEFPKIYDDRESGGIIQDHPHFVQYVIQYLQEKLGEEEAERFLKGGFDIHTTIDTDLQNRAEEIVTANIQNNAQYYGARNASMSVIVPYSGELLAMVGSANFSDASIGGQNNIATSQQQPGSAIKPIVYAAAFEQGWHPGTVVLDAPYREETPDATDAATGEPTPFYEPQNYTRQFYGAVSVRTALSNSLNIPAIKAVQYIGGPSSVIDIARRMGMKHGMDQPESDYGLSIGLGSADIWPLELTNAYATLANNGKYVPVNPILKITDSSGNVLQEIDRDTVYEQAEQALRAEYAYQITSVLTDSASRRKIFGPGNLFETTQQRLDRPTAAKSGTTNDSRDVWTLGYTSDVAVGVWVGNTLNEALVEGTDGIQAAGPIWAQMMEDLHTRPEFAELLLGPNGQPLPTEFPRPAGIVEGPVCEATGGRPTEQNGNRREILVQGGAPSLRCDQLTAWQRGDLAKVMKNSRGGAFVAGAADSINRYARTVRYGGGSDFYLFPPESPEKKDAAEDEGD